MTLDFCVIQLFIVKIKYQRQLNSMFVQLEVLEICWSDEGSGRASGGWWKTMVSNRHIPSLKEKRGVWVLHSPFWGRVSNDLKTLLPPRGHYSH